MEKEYISLINSVIGTLIERENYFVDGINDIASVIEYHGFNENYNLTKGDIETINENRRYIIAIHKLISDLEKLKK